MARDHGQPVFDIEPVIRVAEDAGKLILEMRAAGLKNIRVKSSEIDLVTEADTAAEHLIRQSLGALFPRIGFWGEETNVPPKEEFFWVVDPIDGTINYANGLPFYAVNIALNQGETTLLGVTVELPAQRVYWAKRGEGAFVREAGAQRRICVSSVTNLTTSLLSTGFPYHRTEHPDNNSAEHAHFLGRTQGVRCMGSAAMDLAHVAVGALAGYWEGWLKPWDAAPGVLLVQESGGLVTDYSGTAWRLGSSTLVASNGQPSLHQALLDGIQEARGDLSASLLP